LKKRGIIRAFWGCPSDALSGNYRFEKEFSIDKNNCVIKRWDRIKNSIGSVSKDKDKKQYPYDVIYVFGKENKRLLSDFGIESVLIWDEPFKFHPVRRHWWHKLFAMKYAMENDFNELVWLDWDCKMIKTIDNNFWDVLAKKETFQASLVKYQCQMVNFRKEKYSQYVPNGSFVYLRDRNIPSVFFDMDVKTWTDEVVYAKYTDNIMDGYNQSKYHELFEPNVAASKRSIFRNKKELYFYHY